MKSDDNQGDDFSDEVEFEHGNPPSSRYTTGNEADIEDNIFPPSTPTADQLWERLRVKPIQCTPTTPCRLASARGECKKNAPSSKSTSAQRLTIRPKSALETISDAIERPEGSVPPLALPHWHCLSLDQKIPRVPAPKGLIYYSPGKLCTKLHREPKVFSLTDPYNRERVVGSMYTALHDPHAKVFLERSQTRTLLNNQGLINKNDEIMYSLREFNKFRDYLRTLYSDDVHKGVHFADELWKTERVQMKSIQHYLSQTEGKIAEKRRKLDKSRMITRQQKDYNISRLLQKQEQTEGRLIVWARAKEQLNSAKFVRGSEKSRLQREKLQSLYQARKDAAIRSCHEAAMKDLRCHEQRSMELARLKQAHETFLLEWMDSKINQSRARMDRDIQFNISSREALKMKAAKRQRRVETYRQNLPNLIKKKRMSKARRWDLAKKYFYLWLEITRRRHNLPFRDETHESVWIKGASSTLDETVKYLRFQTDTHEKLDDFILNIIRLKEQIARQLALEEADADDDVSSIAVEINNAQQLSTNENE